MRAADADRPGWKTISNRNKSDISFLAKVKAAKNAKDLPALVQVYNVTLAQVETARKRNKSGPNWRLVVVMRAIDAIEDE